MVAGWSFYGGLLDGRGLVAQTGPTVGWVDGFGYGVLFTVGVVVTILAVGVGLRWRYVDTLDRTVDATTKRPLASLGAGIATHLAIAFAGIYLTARFSTVNIGGVWVGALGGFLGVALVVVTAAFGFTVLGTVVAGVVGTPDSRVGLVIGAAIAGTLTLLDPLVGALLWLVLVSAGIGGFSRRWYSASVT